MSHLVHFEKDSKLILIRCEPENVEFHVDLAKDLVGDNCPGCGVSLSYIFCKDMHDYEEA
jgi:hypothetical protein